MNSAITSDELHATKCELASEVLRSFGTLRLQVTGWSMLPTVWPGDTLIIERVQSDTVSDGDIVLFGRDGRLFAHRLVSHCWKSANVLVRGDAMPALDPPVSESDLLGRVSFIMRDRKRIQPSRRLRFFERALAALVQHSDFAGLAVVHFQRMRQPSQIESQPPDSDGQVIPGSNATGSSFPCQS